MPALCVSERLQLQWIWVIAKEEFDHSFSHNVLSHTEFIPSDWPVNMCQFI